MSTPSGRPATILVCARCFDPEGNPRMTPKDEYFKCTKCGRKWAVTEIPDPRAVERDTPAVR